MKADRVLENVWTALHAYARKAVEMSPDADSETRKTAVRIGLDEMLELIREKHGPDLPDDWTAEVLRMVEKFFESEEWKALNR